MTRLFPDRLRAVSAFAAGLACFAGIAPVAAAELEARKIRNWTAGAYSDDQTGAFSRCTMSVSYKSGITLLFSIDKKYEWSMALVDPDWKLTVGAVHPIRFAIDDLKPFNAQAKVLSRTMVGIPLADNAALFNAFRAGELLEIRAASDTFQFRLDGTSDGLAWLVSCVKRYETWVPPTAKAGNPFDGAPPKQPVAKVEGVPGRTETRRITIGSFAAHGWGIGPMAADKGMAPDSPTTIEVPKTAPTIPPRIDPPPVIETAPTTPATPAKPPLIEAHAPDPVPPKPNAAPASPPPTSGQTPVQTAAAPASAPSATASSATAPSTGVSSPAAAPSTNAALDAVTGGSIETRVEATVMLANLMASAGISGYRILPPSEAPASMVGAEVVFAADGLVGAVRMNPGSDPKAIATSLVTQDSQTCTGQFASGVVPAADGRQDVAHVFTGCDRTGTPTASRYTILSRKKGGFFVVSVMPREGAGAGAGADDKLKQVDGSIRDASLKVVGRF